MADPKTRAEKAAKRSPAEVLLDELIRNHAAFLLDAESEIQKARKVLKQMERDLKTELAKRLPRGTTPETRKRFDQAVNGLREIQDQALGDYGEQVQAAASRMAKAGVTRTLETLGELEPTLEASFDARLGPRQYRAVAKADILGDKASEWFDLEAFNQGRKLARQLRMGYALGESFEEINFRLERHTNNAGRASEALARTVVQGWSNEAAHALYDANDDVLSGKQWIATLDVRTCPQCGPLDGQIWYYGKRSPSVDKMPQAPAHPNCRCFVAPLVAGLSNPNVPTWSEWLERQPAAKLEQALGPTRARLYSEGSITIDQFRDRAGEARSVAELKRLAAAG